MNSLPEDKILQFNPNTLTSVREMYNLNKPGQMDEAINILDDWLKKQNYLIKTDYSREYLERLIILAKGSIERVKYQMDKLCTMKTLFKNYFDKHNPCEDFKDIKGSHSYALLPKLTEDNSRIFFVRFYPNKYSAKLYLNCCKFGMLVAEYARSHDYCTSYIAVIDLREMNIPEFIATIFLLDLNTMHSIVMTGYGFRIKGIHLITPSNTIENLLVIIKKIIGAKMFSKIMVHNNLESLYEYVPKGILPAEYGGREKSLEILFDEWFDHLSTEENVEYSRDIMTKPLINESCRDTAAFNEIYAGMSGTFRNLNLD